MSSIPYLSLTGRQLAVGENESRNLFLYGPVNAAKCRSLCKKLLAFDAKETYEPITLHIQSPGGSLRQALHLVDVIKEMQTEVHTVVDGFAASAATLISISGTFGKRSMHHSSCMLIHEASTDLPKGTSSQIQIMNTNIQAAQRRVVQMYESHTRLRGVALEEELKRDLILDASTCLAYGLVDCIIDSQHTPYFVEGDLLD